MWTTEHLQDTFNMVFGKALEHAVFMWRFLIRDKLAVLAKEAESSMGGYKSDSSGVQQQ